jgi:putative tricarboxylic transport membrane protein
MKWLRAVSSLLLMSFSVVIFASSLNVGIGDFRNPGPGLMGFLASILLIILTGIVLVKENLLLAGEKREASEGSSFRWQSLSKPSILTLALCGYVVVFETLGYLVSTFLLMFIMLLISNPRRWYFHIINALIIVNITYAVFCKMLRVFLPAGTLRISW